jgi:ATP-dependent DNA helicase RecQ
MSTAASDLTTRNLTTSELDEVVKKHFGFSEFRDGQRAVIEHLLAGKSSAAIFPTGGGKSLCYQLPALLLPGVTLVVSPLIALMKDQIDALAARDIAAARLDSTLSADEYSRVMQQVREGQLKLLYVAPERFKNERFRGLVESLQISLFAVDEAHCISEWGHNFRPDYLKLARFAHRCGAERILALTATATPQVATDICRGFRIDDHCAVRTDFYRPNLTLLATQVTTTDRDEELISRLRERSVGATIVYVTLQKTAQQVAAQLATAGFPARAYHAGMKSELRNETQEWFLASDDGIIVATIAFGMGIDKSNIRYIYHYNLAKSLENFAQEIGRAGRDGEPSICESLVCLDDLRTLENFVYGDTPSATAIHSLVNDIFSRGDTFDVNLYDLAHQHDIRDLVLRTMFTYLELEEYLEGGTPFYAEYRFKPLVSSAEILSRFEGERREFLATVFRHARKAKTWFWLNVDDVGAATNSNRQRVVRALDYLAEQQLLEVSVSGVRHRYQKLRAPADASILADELYQRAVDRQAREVARIGQVIELMEQNGCQVSVLGAHFGEPLSQDCGHCSWCLREKKTITLARPRDEAIDEEVWQKAMQLRRNHAEILNEPRSFARFLCGVTSPVLTRSKLSREPLFGCLTQVPFADVLTRASADAG